MLYVDLEENKYHNQNTRKEPSVLVVNNLVPLEPVPVGTPLDCCFICFSELKIKKRKRRGWGVNLEGAERKQPKRGVQEATDIRTKCREIGGENGRPKEEGDGCGDQPTTLQYSRRRRGSGRGLGGVRGRAGGPAG